MLSREELSIIQDHALICHTIDAICCSIENGIDMPNYVPVTNDTLVCEQLTKICETITSLRKKLL